MPLPTLIGIIGAIILVIGAAYPIKKVSHPVKSTKNWLFAIGGLMMLIYAFINYVAGGSIFFVILQLYVNIASILMMINAKERFSISVLSLAGLALIIRSLMLFEGTSTIFFILGLIGIAIGYTLKMGTTRRNLALMIGSLFVAYFSYLEMDWIFLGLNSVFAVFAGYYAVQLSCSKKH